MPTNGRGIDGKTIHMEEQKEKGKCAHVRIKAVRGEREREMEGVRDPFFSFLLLFLLLFLRFFFTVLVLLTSLHTGKVYNMRSSPRMLSFVQIPHLEGGISHVSQG